MTRIPDDVKHEPGNHRRDVLIKVEWIGSVRTCGVKNKVMRADADQSAGNMGDVLCRLTDSCTRIHKTRRDFSSLDQFQSHFNGCCQGADAGIYDRVLACIGNGQSASLNDLCCSAYHQEYYQWYQNNEIFREARNDVAVSEEAEG